MRELVGREVRRAGARASATSAGTGGVIVQHRRREDHLRRVERARELLRAGAVVDEQRLRPRRAAVGAAENAAIAAL